MTTNQNTTTTTTNRNIAKADLWTAWADLVANGDMSAEELISGLRDQISGDCDLSADELTEDRMALLGWGDDWSSLTDEQFSEWRDIVDEAAAEYVVRAIAEANPGLRDRDYDALSEIGEADCETIFGGYLWPKVEEAMGKIGEDMGEYLSCAIVGYYCDMLADAEAREYEGMEEYEAALVHEWQDYAGQDMPLTDDLFADLCDTYEQLVADGWETEDAVYEAVYVVADAN